MKKQKKFANMSEEWAQKQEENQQNTILKKSKYAVFNTVGGLFYN